MLKVLTFQTKRISNEDHTKRVHIIQNNTWSEVTNDRLLQAEWQKGQWFDETVLRAIVRQCDIGSIRSGFIKINDERITGMTLASKFVGMNMKKLSEQISAGSVVTAAIEINDTKDSSKALDAIKKSLNSGKGSLLVLAIRIWVIRSKRVYWYWKHAHCIQKR